MKIPILMPPHQIGGRHGVIVCKSHIHDGRTGEDAIDKVEDQRFSILVLNVIKNTVSDGGDTISI